MENCTFTTSENGEFYVTSHVRSTFEKHGYIVVRNLFQEAEMSNLKYYFENNIQIQKNAYGRSDGNDRISKLSLWNYAGDDLSGIVARYLSKMMKNLTTSFLDFSFTIFLRSQKVAGTMQTLLGGDEIYHYHSKLMMKEPKTGGAHVWHQDYGYWYNNGCLFPEMGSVFIPIDKCTKENGCLQVLDQSHKMGRINHILEGEQTEADPDRYILHNKNLILCLLQF